ncbi:MAG: hypothetical protein ACKVU4_02780, partial [Phycisphaerales bacterium]
IPLGSYPQTQSPWGLLDMTGMTAEHTEFYWPIEGPVDRGSKGADASSSPELFDRIYRFQFLRPSTPFPGLGLRVAAAIPSPVSVTVVIMILAFRSTARRRRAC